jgi:hypothetical protein
VIGTGSANAQSTTVHETAYNGTFGEGDNCSGIATITTSNNHGPNATYTVTGVASGSCTATFSDSFNQTAPVNISVTTNGFHISSKKRQ